MRRGSTVLAQNFFLSAEACRGSREDLWPFLYSSGQFINTTVQLHYGLDMVWGVDLGILLPSFKFFPRLPTTNAHKFVGSSLYVNEGLCVCTHGE